MQIKHYSREFKDRIIDTCLDLEQNETLALLEKEGVTIEQHNRWMKQRVSQLLEKRDELAAEARQLHTIREHQELVSDILYNQQRHAVFN